MCGKYTCGMLTGLIVGSALGMAAKNMQEKSETAKMKKKAKKLINKVEKYVSDSMPFMD